MSDETKSQRRYSDREVSALLSRAVELKKAAAQSDPSESGPGLSLAEIEQIAAEVGIESQYLRAAAVELEGTEPAEKRFSLWGGPTSIRMERTVPGVMSEDKWTAMVREIRHELGSTGKTGQIGQSLEWSEEFSLVTVRSQEGQTSVEITHHPLYHLVVYLGAFVIMLFSTIILFKFDLSPLVRGAIAGGGLIGVLALARSLCTSLMRKCRRGIGELLNRLEAIIAGSVPTGAENAASIEAKETIPSPLGESSRDRLLEAPISSEDLLAGDPEIESTRTRPPQRTKISG